MGHPPFPGQCDSSVMICGGTGVDPTNDFWIGVGWASISNENWGYTGWYVYFGSYLTAGPLEISGTAGGGGNPNEDCKTALKNAKKSMSAVDRANANWDIIEQAANANDIDPALLASVGVLESGFQNVNENDGAGVGVGVFQITVSGASGVTAQQAGNLSWAAGYAANMLSSNMNTLASRFPNFTPTQLLQATAASYNLGVNGISGNPNTIDVGSKPHDNYG